MNEQDHLQALLDVVLKFEQSATHPGLGELEAPALELHRSLGFEVPRHWPCTFRGIPAIAIERRHRQGITTPGTAARR